MAKNALYIQSGGPTTVINASAYGVIQTCKRHPEEIGTLYGVRHGVVGLLDGGLVDIFALDQEQISLLPQTPSMAFGSCRYRLPDAQTDDTDYKRCWKRSRRTISATCSTTAVMVRSAPATACTATCKVRDMIAR